MPAQTTHIQYVRVWDPAIRAFHWMTVALFATAFLSPDEKWLHEPVGYVLLGLAGFRVLWGFVGPRHARFTDFVRSPAAVVKYLRTLGRRDAEHFLGHNPAGGAIIVVMITLLIVAAGSGWMSETDRWFGVPWVEHLHHYSAHLLLILVGVHVLGVIVSSWIHHENLVLAMITGRKTAPVEGTSD